MARGDAGEPEKCCSATQNFNRVHKEEGVKTFMIHADNEILCEKRCHTVCNFRMLPWAQEDRDAGSLNPVFVSVARAVFG